MPTASKAGEPSRGSASAAGYERIIAILEHLALGDRDAGWGVRSLAESTADSPSSVHRILNDLSETGMAERVGTGNYRAGPRLRVLADRILRTDPVLSAAQPIIAKLSDRCAATAFLAVHDWPLPQSFVAAHRAAEGPVRYHLDPGTVLPLHAGAAGQAILSELGPHTLPAQLIAFTDATITDIDQIAERTAEVRERGYALSIGQHFPLAAGVAAPLQVRGLTAAVSVTRPRYNTELDDLLEFAPLVVDAARELFSVVNRGVWRDRPSRQPGELITAGTGGSGTATSRLERLVAALVVADEGLSGTARELGRQIGMNRATATKLIDTAAQGGLAVPVGGRYFAGPKLLHWAAALGRLPNRHTVVETVLRAAATDTEEAIGFTEYIPEHRSVVMTFVAAGPTPLHYGLNAGVELPLHAGAASKAILAHLPSEIAEHIELEPLTDKTITDRSALMDDLDQIRSRGWAFGEGERIPDAAGIAVPYFIDGEVAGSVTATIPRFRITAVDVGRLAAALKTTAVNISELLSVAV